MDRFVPHLPAAVWAVLIATAWMVIMWATTASLAPMAMWFVGLSVLLLLWLRSAAKHTVRVYGPSGKEWLVSPATAARRVTKGWSYERPTTLSGQPSLATPPVPAAVPDATHP